MLKKVVPYVKYMPLFENSHEVFTEHDFWLRGGNSLIRLREIEGLETAAYPMDYLEGVFLNVLPDDLDDWLHLNTKEDGVAFKRRHKEFINLCQVVEEE